MEAILLIVLVASDTSDADKQREIGLLQGTWKVAGGEYQGKNLDRKQLPIERVIFAAKKPGDEVTGKTGSIVLTYRLDLEKSP
jgi:hypothetical protein